LLAELLDRPPAVELTSSCTHALETAALVLDIGPGDEVIVPAFTFPSTANAFLIRGATVRFADVQQSTGNIDPDSVRVLLGPATRAIVCTHYGGVGCEMEALAELAGRSGAQLVEDAAHGMFGRWRGVPLGRFGVFGALSFHHTKNISAGEGGAVVVNDPALVDRTLVALDKGTNRVEFDQGRATSYEWRGTGSAWRMPESSVEQFADSLDRRDLIQAARHEAWARYAEELRDWADRLGAALPDVPEAAEHPAHLFWVLLPESIRRDEFVSHCARRGVQVARHFGSLPDSSQGSALGGAEECAVAGRFGASLVRLPLHEQLTPADVEHVVTVVASFSAG
jgi:dTDP-4-amino-4,6-dideoxygalactose transaminase